MQLAAECRHAYFGRVGRQHDDCRGEMIQHATTQVTTCVRSFEKMISPIDVETTARRRPLVSVLASRRHLRWTD